MLPFCLLITVFTVSTVCQSAVDHTEISWLCDAGWLLDSEHSTCVRYFKNRRTRMGASSFCQAIDAKLLDISKRKTFTFLTSNARQSYRGYWVQDASFPEPWFPTVNIKGRSVDSCVRAYNQSFERHMCNSTYTFVCETREARQRPKSRCSEDWTIWGFTLREDTCYKSFNLSQTYDQATSICTRYGGTLAIPSTETRYRKILDAANGFANGFWIGIRGLRYANKKRLPFCPLLQTGPNGRIGNVTCFSMRKVVCEKPIPFALRVRGQATSQSSDDCNIGWMKMEGSGTADRCISYFPHFANMVFADFTCRIRNARLINITTMEENNFVMINRPNTSVDYWIGASYQRPTEWSPIDLTGGNPKRPCVRMNYYTSGFQRVPCSWRYRYMCEKPAHGEQRCPRGWTYHQDEHQMFCLFSPTNYSNYMDNAADCRARGGYLARPNNELKYTAMQNARSSIHYHHFVGMFRSSQTATMSFDDGPDIESCRSIGAGRVGVSNYGNCALKKYFICEQPIGTP